MNSLLSSKIMFYRNIKDYKFVPKLEKQKQDEIIEKLRVALKDFNLVDMSVLDDKTKAYLIEKDLATPNTKLLFVSKDNKVSIALFAGEHLTIKATQFELKENDFDNLQKVVAQIDSEVSFAYNDKYGYLMSDLSKVGSGVRCEAYFDLHALEVLGKIQQVARNIKNLGYALEKRGKAIYSLSTMSTLGFTSKEVFDAFVKTMQNLQNLEDESINMLYATNTDEITDQVKRSYAILQSAHLMDYDELSNHLSNLRIGNVLKIINLEADKLIKLQNLTKANNQFITKDIKLALAQQVKTILKGE